LPAVVAERDVADGAQHLALLVDLDLSVTLRGEIEPADRRPLERTDRGQRGRRQLFVIGEFGQRRKRRFLTSRLPRSGHHMCMPCM